MSADPAGISEPRASTLAAQLQRADIAAAVECRGCGYDLQGLAADGNCPECGLSIPDTITSLVDPEASRLPRLRNPRRVGNQIVLITATLAVSALLLMARPVWAWTGLPPMRVPMTGYVLPADLNVVAALVALVGLWPSLRLVPARGIEPRFGVRRDVWLLVIGVLGWSGAALFWQAAARGTFSEAVPPLVLLLASAAVLLGLGGILRTIGRRSRAYRRSRAGRQSARTMIVALVGIAAGIVLRTLAAAGVLPDQVRMLATVVGSVCALMAAIGLPYLVLNTWWIRTALRRPPPSLDQVLLPRLPSDAHLPEEVEGLQDGDAPGHRG